MKCDCGRRARWWITIYGPFCWVCAQQVLRSMAEAGWSCSTLVTRSGRW